MPESTPKVLPQWDCKIDSIKPTYTVGEKLQMVCSGFDEVPASTEEHQAYSQSTKSNRQNPQASREFKDPYRLKILKTLSNDEHRKEYTVTSYRVSQQPVLFKMQDANGKDLFISQVQDFKFRTVIQQPLNQVQPAPPDGFRLYLYGVEIMIGLSLVFLIFIGFLGFRSFRSMKRKSDYKKTIEDIKYDDPFLELNIALSNLNKKTYKAEDFQTSLPFVFKKFFYQYFEKPVFFDQPAKMSREFKLMGVKSHEQRSVWILRNDYLKIVNGEISSKEDFKVFIEQSKKTLNRLRKSYVEKERRHAL